MHQVIVVPLAVHPTGSVSVTDEEDPVGVASLAQCASRLILSSASLAVSCAWKRLFMSVSELDAETKTVVRLVMTTPSTTMTVSISTSV